MLCKQRMSTKSNREDLVKKIISQKISTKKSTIESRSNEAIFGLSMSRFAFCFGTSRNLVSMYNRYERSLPLESRNIKEVFDKTFRELEEKEVIEKILEFDKLFEEEHIKFLKRNIKKLQRDQDNLRLKLESIITKYYQLCRNIVYLRNIVFTNITDPIAREKTRITVETAIFEKTKLLKQYDLSKQNFIKNKIVGIESMLKHAEEELRLLEME
jgi:hypothetical protein